MPIAASVFVQIYGKITEYKMQQKFTMCTNVHFNTVFFNPSPAEPGYTLPLQTV